MANTVSLKVTPLSAFQDNYIWAIHDFDNHSNVVIVDPGDADVVKNALNTKNWTLKAILITHHHHDHIGGLLELKELYSVPVYGPAMEKIAGIDHKLSHNQTIKIPETSLEFSILDLPGHTLGHIAFYGHRLVFFGDTLFSAGCGRMFEGTPQAFYESLNELAALPDDTAVYCTHEYTQSNLKFAHHVEPDNSDISAYQNYIKSKRAKNQISLPSTIALEKKINPFLHCDQRDLQLKLAKLSRQSSEHLLGNPVNTFATLRKLKDNF